MRRVENVSVAEPSEERNIFAIRMLGACDKWSAMLGASRTIWGAMPGTSRLIKYGATKADHERVEFPTLSVGIPNAQSI